MFWSFLDALGAGDGIQTRDLRLGKAYRAKLLNAKNLRCFMPFDSHLKALAQRL